jgi:hypothetical protein
MLTEEMSSAAGKMSAAVMRNGDAMMTTVAEKKSGARKIRSAYALKSVEELTATRI